MRLSTRLLLIIAMCLVPTVAVQVALTWNQWSERKAQLGGLVIQQAQLLGGTVDGIADSAHLLLGSASEFRQVRHRDVNCGDRLARLLRHAQGFAFLLLVEADGRADCASEPGLMADQQDAPWLRAARDVQTFTTGRHARMARLPGGFLPFYLPVRASENAGAGVLIAALDLNWLETHLQGLKRTSGPFLASGVLTVADADGVVLARDTRHAEFVGQRFPDAALPLLTALVPGTLSLQSMDGTARLVGFTPPTAQNHHLASVVGVHEPEMMGDIAGALRRGALLLAAVTLLATLLTLFVARRFIATPTRSLLATARRWQDGDLAARAPACGRGSEFGQLAVAFNEMAAALQRRQDELQGHAAALEIAVEERTRALTLANQRLRAEIDERRSTEQALVQAQKVQAVGQLAGGIAHDFNNVLQAVLGGVALIRKRANDTEAVQRLACMIEESTRRGESITRRLLTFSRRDPLRAEPLDIREMLAGLREVLAATLGSRIRVVVHASRHLPTLLADRGQLETVLVNLATNARDAMPQGGTLTLSADVEELLAPRGPLAPGSYVRLAASDTGEGMDAETLARASDAFFTTKALGQGTGLGLTMARSFAQGSRGHLEIDSAPGRGTTVSIWLPVVAATSQEPVRRPIAQPGRHVAEERPWRLLLVDDEAVVREVLAAELEDAGFDVAQAADGVAALALLDEEHGFDLLVSDLSMPGLDGVGLIREAQRRHPSLPAILLTGFAGDAATLAIGGAIAGRFLLVRKPVAGAVLADHAAGLLDAALRATQPAS
jgi:signal transduction histidine kinase